MRPINVITCYFGQIQKKKPWHERVIDKLPITPLYLDERDGKWKPAEQIDKFVYVGKLYQK